MQLNHIDLPVPDVAATSAFFQDYLGFQHLQTMGDHEMAILRGEGGLVLVLNRRAATDSGAFPDSFHIGFLLESDQAVHAAYARLKDAPLEQLSAVQESHGACVFFLQAPGGIRVEISHRQG